MLKTQTTNITTTAAAAATNGNEKPKNTKNKNIYETETKKIEKKKLKTRLNLKRNLVTFFPSLATPLLRCFSSLIDVPVYTHIAWRRERAGGEQSLHSRPSKCKAATTVMATPLTQESDKWRLAHRSLSLSLSQRNATLITFAFNMK